MKPLVIFTFGFVFFLFGVGFYHYVVLQGRLRQLEHHGLRTTDPLAKSRVNDHGPWLPLKEVVRGPLAQDDPRLLRFINSNGYLHPPSDLSADYNLTFPHVGDTSMGQAKMALRALNSLKGGYFVECGALDGELRSNTLLLERKFGWKGLLIEGDPKNFDLLRQKKRKAWISPACLSIHPYPHESVFEQSFNRGKIRSKRLASASSDSNASHRPSHHPRPSFPPKTTTAKVQCFPLYSLLAALNVSVVDYFSLDVEGSELMILDTIPFDKLRVKVLSVEFLHSPGGREALRRKMTSKGYRVYGEVRDPIHNWANDLVFIHHSLLSKHSASS